MLRAEGLAKSFVLHLRGGARIDVLDGIDLSVRAGECVVLSGRSGAGKSTLLRALYGTYRPDGGKVLVRHGGSLIDIAVATPRELLAVRAASIFHVSQFLRVVPRVAAVAIVAEAAPGPDAVERAGALLHRLNIATRLHALPPATFSGGEQQRVNLARGFIAGRPILLLDEPTASLDAANRDIVVGMIREAKWRGTAIVTIVHDALVRDAIADRVFELTPRQDAA